MEDGAAALRIYCRSLSKRGGQPSGADDAAGASLDGGATPTRARAAPPRPPLSRSGGASGRGKPTEKGLLDSSDDDDDDEAAANANDANGANGNASGGASGYGVRPPPMLRKQTSSRRHDALLVKRDVSHMGVSGRRGIGERRPPSRFDQTIIVWMMFRRLAVTRRR